MSAGPKQGTAQPFFLPATPGQRFCLFHPPQGESCRGAVLYVHPFGDEMNKARRMAALQARAMAAAGFGVLQIDLYGCGDSSGDFVQARWDIWKADLAIAASWLEERLGEPLTLWALRLGALLALDYLKDARHPVSQLILWQPVSSGSAYLSQFLRLLTARAIVADSANAPAPNTAAMRKTLLEGQVLEVGGYELAPELAAAINGKELALLAPEGTPVQWFETASVPERPIAPAIERLLAGWRAQGADVHLHRLAYAQFWATQEIEEAPDLLAATVTAMCEGKR